ncbi:MAG TPA: HAMP domain-containing methyl-accepting chemotaxis protein [Salinivirgaceae bacterium]|mgnify:CR=1 FL=1|nr:HAMP domain-containing methyl-accepting chemotaxis protein [Salinivirgaceae bacterium]HQA75597.1 HAMP domain-containing methyl-accepting chemotaxis protein [Salinivirgaceae bacterium]
MSDFAIYTIAVVIAVVGISPVLLVMFRKTILKKGFVAVAFVIGFSAITGNFVAFYGLKMLWISLPLVVAAGISVLYVLTRAIQSPIRGLIRNMENIADTGDLTVRASQSLANREDEIGQMIRAFERVIEETQKALQESERVSQMLIEASEQFKAQSNFIATRANDQSSSTEEISSAMEEMASNINQNLENATQSANIGQQVNNEVGEVSEAFNRTSKVMSEIREKTVSIGEIARKINVLAINAAIEAARAGEYGRGFAVVAAEVRHLADQSQRASTEIDGISLESAKAVEEMGQKLDTVVPNIRKAVILINEIAAASGEQQQGADQISTALNQLVQITNENSSTSEELSAGAEQLVDLSNTMGDSLAKFTL